MRIYNFVFILATIFLTTTQFFLTTTPYFLSFAEDTQQVEALEAIVGCSEDAQSATDSSIFLVQE